MPYTVYLEAKVTDDESGDEVASLSRFYEVENLMKICAAAEHFGKSAGHLVEGVGLGLDPSS